MREKEKKVFTERIQKTFLHVVKLGLNDTQAQERVSQVKAKYPGLTKNALADILIRQASRKTSVTGAGSGVAITVGESVLLAPAPEPMHKAAAISGIGASMVGDLTLSTRIQMRLLQDIAYLYECPFDENDEEDVWLVFQAAQGAKGIEQAGGYFRFIFAETATKQLRNLLRNKGVRKAVQDMIIRVAGKRVGKLLAEKYVLRLVPFANIAIGLIMNHALTKGVGKWAKTRAKIRSGMFRILEELDRTDPGTAKLILPVVFAVGTSDNKLTDNTLALYAQTAKRLKLTDEDIKGMEYLNEDSELLPLLAEMKEGLLASGSATGLMRAGVITAAASRLEYVEKHHEFLMSLSCVLGVAYTGNDLIGMIEHFRGLR